MIQIRNSAFETNSSSSHSIIVTKNDLYHDKIDPEYYMNSKGEIKIWNTDDLDFGRCPFDILYEWYEKLRYAIATFKESKIEEIEDILRKHIDGFSYIVLPEERAWNNEEHQTYYGYIDHQSYGLLENFLEKNNVTLDQFLFNDRYVVIIDGDEYCIFDRFAEAGLLDNNNIEKQTGAYDD